MTPVNILPGRVADRKTFFELLNRRQKQVQNEDGSMRDNPHHTGQKNVGEFFEIMEEEYDYMLNVLPPMGWVGGSFAMMEFDYGNRTESYHQFPGNGKGDRFFCMLIEYTRPESVQEARRALNLAIR
jgi:hypothetical protein